jgi:hypothetical protein
MLKGETPGRSFTVDKEIMVLGRDDAHEIVLSDSAICKKRTRIILKHD